MKLTSTQADALLERMLVTRIDCFDIVDSGEMVFLRTVDLDEALEPSELYLETYLDQKEGWTVAIIDGQTDEPVSELWQTYSAALSNLEDLFNSANDLFSSDDWQHRLHT